MAFLTWLPAEAQAADIDLYVMPGAMTRTTRASGFVVNGVVWHHTATSRAWLDGHVALLLRDGRPDLSGPLSQFGIERDGTAVLVAAGRCNHNGYGEWGNDSVGLEFYNDGKGELLTAKQYETGLRLTTVICKHAKLAPASRVKAHRETDPGRKIDLLPGVLSMAKVRNDVAARLAGGQPPAPAPPLAKESSMTLVYLIDQDRYIVVTPWGEKNITKTQGYAIDSRNEGVQAWKLTNAEWDAVRSHV